jgi:hypothetical protein
MVNQQPSSSRSVCKVNTQDPENFDEELKSLVTAWLTFPWCRQLLLFQEVADSHQDGHQASLESQETYPQRHSIGTDLISLSYPFQFTKAFGRDKTGTSLRSQVLQVSQVPVCETNRQQGFSQSRACSFSSLGGP